MLNFALVHLKINDKKALHLDSGHRHGTASLDLVDKVTTRYFGRKMQTGRAASFPVEVTDYDFDTYVFSEVVDVVDLGNGMIRATGCVYATAPDEKIDPHADPSVWKRAGVEVDLVGQFAATVRATGNRYILLDYQQTSAQ